LIYTCGIALLDKWDNLLVGHPTNNIKNIWSIPKGIQNVGETFSGAALREFREETSWTIEEPIKFIGEYEYPNQKKTLIGFFIKIPYTIDIGVFKCYSMIKSKSGKPMFIPFPEIDRFKWMNINDLTGLHPTQKQLMNDIKEIIK